MFKYILKYNNTATVVSSLFIFFIPTFAFSQGLIPCTGGATDPCNFNDFIDLIREVVNFLMFKVALPLSALLFSWAGVLMLTAGGNETKIKEAKDIFWWVFVGILVTLAAWVLVSTITGALLSPEFRTYF